MLAGLVVALSLVVGPEIEISEEAAFDHLNLAGTHSAMDLAGIHSAMDLLGIHSAMDLVGIHSGLDLD